MVLLLYHYFIQDFTNRVPMHPGKPGNVLEFDIIGKCPENNIPCKTQKSQ